LSNVKPPPSIYDPSKHLAEIYLDVLKPLKVRDGDLNVQISLPLDVISKFRSDYIGADSKKHRSIGLLIGAGNPSRKWPLENFVDLARRLYDLDAHKVFVFLGPEEKPDESSIRQQFGNLAIVVPDLSLIELASAFSTLDLVIGNDTGTTHLAAVSGPRVVMICDERAPDTFAPLGNCSATIKTDVIEKITIDDVWSALDLSHERGNE
jgi:ADP-heptose:LPS heptosyltransferase